MRTPHPIHPQATAGSVFIVVLVVCLGLVSLTLVFGNSMLMAYRGADNDMAGKQAEQAIEGGVRYAKYLMINVSRPGAVPDPTTFQSDTLPVGDATFWFIGKPATSDPVDRPAFGLVDEASKLNLNTATKTMLMGLPGMTQELASAIVAWRTSTSTSGTASQSAASTPNSTIKGSRYESVDELALVTGTDQSILYGNDTNLNHVLDSNEENTVAAAFSGSQDDQIGSGLLEYVTVFSREPNTLTDGTTKRINITQPVSTRLTTLLAKIVDDKRAREIEQKIRAAGTLTSVLHFYIASGMTEAEFAKIASSLTAKDGTYVTGLVNVNTASATVLACIPGIADKAASLVAARTNQSQPPANLAWVVPILGNANAIKAGPYLTANSYQLSVDVAAVGRHGRGYRRTRFVLDNSTGTPCVIHRRNLAPLGWALGDEVRDTLAMKKEMK